MRGARRANTSSTAAFLLLFPAKFNAADTQPTHFAMSA